VGWSMDGVPAQPTAQGSMVVHVGVGGGVLIFTPWRSARLGYFISGATFLLLLASLSFWRTGRVNPEPIKPTEAR
jgi:hypothetical protein